MGQPIIQLEIMGKDAAKLQKFYADVFSWQVNKPGGPEFGFYALVPSDSSGLAVGIGQEPSGTARTTAYIQVPDLQATLDRAVSMGGKVVVPPTEIPGVLTFAHFADPEGNLIGLTKG
jgi:predicted enzyme related to lactoylglutathione lyase